MDPIWKALLFGLLCLIVAQSSQGCDSGFFGDNCEFICHCDKYNCDSYGNCNAGSKCVKGWFGPACQYVDLTATKSVSSTPAWLSDGDDGTCFYGSSDTASEVTLKLTEPFPVNWIRIVVDETAYLGNVKAEFFRNGKSVECSQSNIVVGDTIKDVRCHQQVTIDEVKLSGAQVHLLCSVYISGGRNVAIKQETTQSSTGPDITKSGSSNAVDGNTNGDFDQGSCTSTITSDASPTWSVMFSKPEMINRYVIYNRQGDSADQLKGFRLKSYNATSDLVFEYTDTAGSALPVYNVKVESTGNPSPISKITVEKTGTGLSICEFEAYADCGPSNYGLGCRMSCAEGCAACSADGLCYSCLAGWMGNNCDKECSNITFGPGCTSYCSSKCVHSYCDRFTGKCNACAIGKKGDHCVENCKDTCASGRCNQNTGKCSQCKAGFWGSTCEETCTGNCEGGLCDQSSDKCLYCKKGNYNRDQCLLVCEKGCTAGCDRNTGKCDTCADGQWGTNCQNNCSRHCTLTRCDEKSGSCQPCAPGWKGHMCDTACHLSYYGYDCLLRCDNCKNHDCNKETGKCNTECLAGWTGDACDIDCGVGKYGENCKGTCSSFCNQDNAYPGQIPACDRITGVCFDGCQNGYEGPRCMPSKSSNFRGESGLVIGVGILVYVLGLW